MNAILHLSGAIFILISLYLINFGDSYFNLEKSYPKLASDEKKISKLLHNIQYNYNYIDFIHNNLY